MTLYTNGTTPATESEILSAASAISRGRQKRQNGGRKPKLSKNARLDAMMRLAAGESVNSVARSFGVSWSTINRLKPPAE